MGQAAFKFSEFFEKHGDVHPFYETRGITENDGALKSTWPIEAVRDMGLVNENNEPIENLKVRPFYTDADQLGLIIEEP